ncbi:MAG: DHH family phosphoesterase [Candidatus Woesearchaeota archaeon]
MELTPKQQTTELIKKYNNILIVTEENNKGDGISSSLALYLVLSKLGKNVSIAKSNKGYNPVSFLKNTEKIHDNLNSSDNFIISLSLKNAKADKVRYEVLKDKLNFFITPKEGDFLPSDVSFSNVKGHFDLIIVLDCVDFDHVGSLYEENTQFFFDKPVINIDHSPSNEYYGTVNYVDLTASSTSEIMVSLIDSLGQGLIDEEVATCLLAGILVDTNSFQNSRTTPKSLTTTAQLVAAGARHEEVVKMLFKTKTFDVLKIWGMMLSSVETDEESNILWTSINKSDIKSGDLTSDMVDELMEELLSTVANINIYLLILFDDLKAKVFLRTKQGIDARKIAYLFRGRGRGERGEFIVEGYNLEEISKKIISQIKEYLKQYRIVS